MCNTNTAETTGPDLGLTDVNHTCSCESASTTQADVPVNAEAINQQYLVAGMTCNHCVSSITEEVSAVDGVESVAVELNTGGASRVTVTTSKPVPADAIEAAVTEAGYSLVQA